MRYLVLACATLIAGPGLAQQFDNNVTIRASGYFPKIDSSIQVGLPDQPGPIIDLESDLDFDQRSSLPAVAINWRINDDWVLTGEFFNIQRSTGATLSREITVGDTTYPIDANVSARFGSNIYRGTIGYLVHQTDKFEFAVALGLHATDFQFEIEGVASVGEAGGGFRSESRSVFAPLPTLGAVVNWEPAPKVTVSTRVDWLSLTIDEYSGRLINAELSGAYRVWRRVDVGAMLRYVDYRVDVSRDNWVGQVRYKIRGPAIFMQIGF